MIVLTSTVVATVVVACLYFAQVLLIPVVLATFLTFLLAPIVAYLQRKKLGRTPSVLIVVLLVALVLSGTIWMIAVELQDLLDGLPEYTENIKGKVRAFRDMGEGTRLGHIRRMVEDIAQEWNLVAESPGAPNPTLESPEDPFNRDLDLAPEPKPEAQQAQAVVAMPSRPEWLSQATGWLQPLMTPIGHIGLSLILAIFMLLKREALRNRIIVVIGADHMTATTKAVDDAAYRISRFLRMQFLVNSTYGIAWKIGLYFFGLDYFMFWGFLAAALRYIPYLGAWIAGTLPLTLSLAQFPGWGPTLGILAYLIVLELLSNNVMEPLLYGQSIGVSEVALLVSAALWAFLWGPIGLVLSGPLTVCLMVLGKHLPQLNFLVVLLGDQPALDKDICFYQRLLAHDEDEAMRLISDELKSVSLEEVYDQIILPALVHAKRERERDELTDEEEDAVVHAIRKIVQELLETREEKEPEATTEDDAEPPSPPQPIVMLAYPSRDKEDQLALEMLQSLLDPAQWDVRIAAPEALVDDLLEDAAASALLCIGTLPPGGLMHTRYVCKRLAKRFPHLRILAGRWGLREGADATLDQLREAGALAVSTTLAEARAQIEALLPVLAEEDRAKAASEARAAPSASSPDPDAQE